MMEYLDFVSVSAIDQMHLVFFHVVALDSLL